MPLQPKTIYLLKDRLTVKRCRKRKCQHPEFHTHHLTPLGKKLYTGSWR